MRVLAAMVVCGLVVAASHVSTRAAGTSHRESTAFELADQGGILVPVMLNGAGPFRLLLDTGATHSSISDEVARTIAAPVVARTTLTTSIGEGLHAVARLDRFELGPIVAEGLLPSLIRTEAIDARGTVEGVVGQDILAPLRYTIDFRTRRITWGGDSAGLMPGGSVFALEFLNGRFVVELPQRTSTLRLVPDTGSGGLVLFARPDRQLPSTTPAHGTAELSTLTGRRHVQQVTVHELHIGTTTWRDVMAVLVERQGAGRAEADGLLPLHRFRRVTFDGPRRLIIVHG